MLNLKLILGVLATALVAVRGQDSIDQNDVPNECQSQCQNVINQSQNCDNQYDNNNNNNNSEWTVAVIDLSAWRGIEVHGTISSSGI